MATTINIISTMSTEVDSSDISDSQPASFDVGGFTSQENQSFAYFPGSSLPAGAIVTAASVRLRQYTGNVWDKDNTIRCRVCNEYITHGSITWSNRPEVSPVYADLTITSNTDAYRTWTFPVDLLNAYNMAQYKLSNYFILWFYGTVSDSTSADAKCFRHSDYSTVDYRPLLTLSYVLGHAKIWNGSAWVDKPLKFWNGSAWLRPQPKCGTAAHGSTNREVMRWRRRKQRILFLI